MSNPIELIILALLGAISGFLNVVAGGGSLLTLPFLIFLGLPANVANGTNRIAILVQNVFATVRFHQFKATPKGVTLLTSVPAILGSILGALVAVEINEAVFRRVLAIVMILIMGLMFFGPGKNASKMEPAISKRKMLFLAAAFFGVGFYGGFIQGGIGFVIIAILAFAGYDLVKTNALKVLVTLIFTPFAIAIFIVNGQVEYLTGSVLAAGSAVGAWLATRVVVEKGHNFIRWMVMITMAAFAVKLLFG